MGRVILNAPKLLSAFQVGRSRTGALGITRPTTRPGGRVPIAYRLEPSDFALRFLCNIYPMKILPRIVMFAGLPLALSAAQPWQEVIVPSVAEAAAAFPSPPKEYGAITWATGSVDVGPRGPASSDDRRHGVAASREAAAPCPATRAFSDPQTPARALSRRMPRATDTREQNRGRPRCAVV